MYRDVTELTRDEMRELKCNYMYELVDEGKFAEVMGRDYDEPDLDDLANANEYIPDEVMFEQYGHISFVKDDFFCNMED